MDGRLFGGERQGRFPARAESLEFRLDNEKMLIGKALKQPLLGWGGWSRSHVFDRDNKDLTIIDGLWILLMGETGLIGLTAFCIMVIGPALLIWKRIPTRFWSDPACAAAVALAVVITMYMLDSLFNATFNQVAVLTIGAVVSIGGVAKDVFNRGTGEPSRNQPPPIPAALWRWSPPPRIFLMFIRAIDRDALRPPVSGGQAGPLVLH